MFRIVGSLWERRGSALGCLEKRAKTHGTPPSPFSCLALGGRRDAMNGFEVFSKGRPVLITFDCCLRSGYKGGKILQCERHTESR